MKWILMLFGFSREEIYLFQSIKAARKVQETLWGKYNSLWTLEEWKRMFNKRLVKIHDIDSDNPHANIELKKRILQNTALGIAMLGRIDSGFSDKCNIPSNLPQYATMPKKIEDMDAELLADLRNKLTPVKNALAMVEHEGTIQHELIRREIEHAKDVIKYICQQP